MRKWHLLAAAVAVVSTQTVVAQGDLRSELNALKARMTALEAENAELKANQAMSDEAALEEQINALLATGVNGPVQTANAAGAKTFGELRFRSNYSLGDWGDLEHDGSYTSALARLGFDFDVTDGVMARISFDADWTFGTSNDGAGGGLSANLHEAWFQSNDTFGVEGMTTKTGRQEVAVGNEFILGSGDWYQGYTHDGVRVDYASADGKWALTGLAVALAASAGDGDSLYQSNSALFNSHDDSVLYGAYFTFMASENLNFDAYFLMVDAHGGGSLGTLGNNIAPTNHQTFGGRVYGDIEIGEGDNLDYNLEIAYQTGDDIAGTTMEVKGWAIEGEIRGELSLGEGADFDAFLRVLYATGPDGNDSGFVPVFPDRHSSATNARYGIADIMPMTNVLSIQGGLLYELDEEVTLGTTFIWAQADETVSGDDSYGYELDFFGEWKRNDNLSYAAGVALIFPDDQLVAAAESMLGLPAGSADDDTQVFIYVQARLTF